MDPAYRAAYGELYRRHWWWRAREAAILTELRRLSPPLGWSHILDIGCGDGLLFDRLSAFGTVEGVEPESALLDPGGRWRQAIHNVPFDQRFQPGHRFGLILFLDVLEHLERPEDALQSAIRLLEPGGVIVVTVPAFQGLWTRHDEMNHHLLRYDKPTFRRLAAAAGLRIARERYLFQWLAPVKLAVRGLEALRPAGPNRKPPAIPPSPLNLVLTALTRLEAAVAVRLSLPFGSSLLVTGTAAAPD